MTSHYKTLELDIDASDEVIRAVYKVLALKYHPDRDTGDAKKMQEVNEAHDVLSDADKKLSYDFCLHNTAQEHSKPAAPKDEPVGFFTEELAGWSNIVTVIKFLIIRIIVLSVAWIILQFLINHVSFK